MTLDERRLKGAIKAEGFTAAMGAGVFMKQKIDVFVRFVHFWMNQPSS
jgi:hypothetical protein